MGLRLANEGSFEHEYGTKWKALVMEHKQKELELKEEMAREVEKLQAQMEIARYDYETEMLRQRKTTSFYPYLTNPMSLLNHLSISIIRIKAT